MKDFEEYFKEGAVKKQRIDTPRAKSLLEAAEKRKEVMKKYIPLNEETTVQIIEECYDIIRELIESKLSKEGYKTYSHETTIAYLKKANICSESEIRFIDELRKIRHGTKYYGKNVEIHYAQTVLSFLNEIYEKLKEFAMK